MHHKEKRVQTFIHTTQIKMFQKRKISFILCSSHSTWLSSFFCLSAFSRVFPSFPNAFLFFSSHFWISLGLPCLLNKLKTLPFFDDQMMRNMDPGFLSPYRGERYHLRETREGGVPQGPQERFNYLHSSLRNVIERCFGVPFSYSQGHALFLVEAEVHCTCLLCYPQLY